MAGAVGLEGVAKVAGAVPVQTALYLYDFPDCQSKGPLPAWKGLLPGRRKAWTYPEGQQAGWLLASRAQTWLFWQQTPAKAEPWPEQL